MQQLGHAIVPKAQQLLSVIFCPQVLSACRHVRMSACRHGMKPGMGSTLWDLCTYSPLHEPGYPCSLSLSLHLGGHSEAPVSVARKKLEEENYRDRERETLIVLHLLPSLSSPCLGESLELENEKTSVLCLFDFVSVLSLYEEQGITRSSPGCVFACLFTCV